MRRVIAGGLLALLAGAAAPAGEAAPEAPKVSPEAARVIKKVGDYYAPLKSWRVEGLAFVEERRGGRKDLEQINFKLAFQRPNLFSLRLAEVKGGKEEAEPEFAAVCDGRQMVAGGSQPMREKPRPAPQDFEGCKLGDFTAEMVDDDSPQFAAFLLVMFLGPTVRKDPGKALAEESASAELLAQEEVEHVKCDHLRFKTGKISWDLWVEAGEKPLVRKLVFDITPLMGEQRGGEGETAVLNTVLTKWEPEARLAPETFALPAAPAAKGEADDDEDDE